MSRKSLLRPLALSLLALSFPGAVAAQEEEEEDEAPEAAETGTDAEDIAAMDEFVVVGKAEDILGTAPAASKGQVSAQELADRPFLRHGELLEVVPGMIVTQHSGTGKANQYFIRGYNLDHGTDFGIWVDGMPVNHRTHGHGQGYADINFLIPELVEQLDYFKGPYYAERGDFTSAGRAEFKLYDVVPTGTLSAAAGEDEYLRGLVMDSISLEAGTLSGAFEFTHYNGPWVLDENSKRFNGFLRFFQENGTDRLSVTAMAYYGEWDSTDQIPRRLVDAGVINRLGFVDDTVGGQSHRYSLSFDWGREGETSTTEINAYGGYYDLDLFSNFTYFLDDPVNGDQFNQVDKRWFAGARVVNSRPTDYGGLEGELNFGIETHHDWIEKVALNSTSERNILSVTRSDEVYEMNLSAFAEQNLTINDWMRAIVGLRGDLYHFDVEALQAPNTGKTWDGIASPKVSVIFGPWNETELYVNWGGGFHSNDARGTVIRVDPTAPGTMAMPVEPLVRQWGGEVGVRTQAVPDLVSTLAVFFLESDSELVFVGDAGNTEEGPGTSRYGVEFSNYWRPASWLSFDAEFTATRGELRDRSQGKYIENSVPITVEGGITVGEETGPYATLRSRYFSERPLTTDKSVESGDSLVFNLRTGFRKRDWEAYVEILNLLDTDANDIEYLYASRLPGEPAAGVDDIHFHPIEPRTFRAGVKIHF